MESFPCLLNGRINIVKTSILSRAIYRFNAISLKILLAFCLEIERNPKIHIEPQKTPTAKAILDKKNKAGAIKFPDFKIICKATIIKSVVLA